MARAARAAEAAATLLSPAGLVWRLQRGALLGWAIGMLGFGLIFGAMSEQIQDVRGTALEWYTAMGGTDQVLDAYRASMIEMAGMAVAIYVVQVLLRMRTDEADGTLEPVLATAVSRPRWVAGHVLNAAVGARPARPGLRRRDGPAGGAVMGDAGSQVRELIAAGLVQLPGDPRGRRRRRRGGRGCCPAGPLRSPGRCCSRPSCSARCSAPSLGLPQWAQDLSPFTHVPKAPAADVTAAPLVALCAACVFLLACGVAALRRRDLQLPA